MNDHKTAESDYKLQHVRVFLCPHVCLSEWNNWTRTWRMFIFFFIVTGFCRM